jgi:predicted Zn-dependent protease
MSRLLLALTAVAVASWLALSFASERREARAAAVSFVAGDASPREVGEALRLARKARAWQADTGPNLVEWRLLYNLKRFRQAEALLGRIAAEEPANADVWGYLAQTARDPRVSREARRRFLALRGPPAGRRTPGPAR